MDQNKLFIGTIFELLNNLLKLIINFFINFLHFFNIKIETDFYFGDLGLGIGGW